MEALNLRIMAIDAALENTGYCMYAVCPKTFAHRITDIGVITTEPGEDLDSRVRKVITEITNIGIRCQINCYLIEQPPQTIYGQGAPVNVVIGRASKMFGVFASAFGLMGYFHAHGLYHRMILPVEWQPQFKKKGMSKPWSLRQAANVLKHLRYDYNIGDNDHIADAINIGRKAILNYYEKKWAMPTIE
jgi:hypothetical protein